MVSVRANGPAGRPSRVPPLTPVETASAEARGALDGLYRRLRDSGLGAPDAARGQMIRPLLAVAGAMARGHERDESFWSAVAAVQLAHEASLLHDDVIDGAATRRSKPTLAAARGVAVALVEGDHLLTTAYRLAAATGSPDFVRVFAQAVERTVAGEKLQGRSGGKVLDEDTYRTIVRMKSGELLGCALAAAPLLECAGDSAAWYEAGQRLGTLYQMLDDLLDYCPATDTGKPPLGDYEHGRWTWPLLELPGVEFGGDASQVAARFAGPDAGGNSPLQRCGARFAAEAASVRAILGRLLPGDTILEALLDDWTGRVAAAVRDADAVPARQAATLRRELGERLAGAADRSGFFRRNSRSFSFAARLFPADMRERVGGVYAFCRITDDLADTDDGSGADHRLARLEVWSMLARQAYHGTPTGLELLDSVMADAAASGVPFRYVEELVEGMRMDVRGERYRTLDDLHLYCYRVAGVVGQWLTRLAGVHDDDVLDRAALLGRAMQLTNIIRDVGEDLARNRVYIPSTTLRAFGVTESELRALAGGLPLTARYVRMVRHLMAVADADYRLALQATPALPGSFRFAVAAAAWIYRGIHGAVEANACDNLTLRARTTGAAKFRLGVEAVAAEALRAIRGESWPARIRAASGARPTLPVPAPLGAAGVAAPRPASRGRAAVIALALLTGTAPVASGQVRPVPPAAVAAEPAEPAPPPTPAAAAQWAAELEARLAAAPADPAVALDLARACFFVAVEDGSAIARGRAALAQMREHDPAFAGSHEPLLQAYDGAFLALEARHGTWPHARLRAVRAGLRLLDAAVRRAPHDVEVRYLRLVNTHYLPGLFGRREGARSDRLHVARLMAEPQPQLHPALRQAIAGFLRDTGR
jgi:15-cis-phytoene synthase